MKKYIILPSRHIPDSEQSFGQLLSKTDSAMLKNEMSSTATISKLIAVVDVVDVADDWVFLSFCMLRSVVVWSFDSGFGFQNDEFNLISFIQADFIESNDADRKTVEPDIWSEAKS